MPSYALGHGAFAAKWMQMVRAGGLSRKDSICLYSGVCCHRRAWSLSLRSMNIRRRPAAESSEEAMEKPAASSRHSDKEPKQWSRDEGTILSRFDHVEHGDGGARSVSGYGDEGRERGRDNQLEPLRRLSEDGNLGSVDRRQATNKKERNPGEELIEEELGQWSAADGWKKMFAFPNKLIRDVAFVVFCPQLLLSSHELPTVDDSFFRTRTTHDRSALLEWLKSLCPDAVEEWFRNRRRSARLGDHFADCVEYVLRFGPNVRPQQLQVSVQVHLEMSPAETSQQEGMGVGNQMPPYSTGKGVATKLPIVWETMGTRLENWEASWEDVWAEETPTEECGIDAKVGTDLETQVPNSVTLRDSSEDSSGVCQEQLTQMAACEGDDHVSLSMAMEGSTCGSSEEPVCEAILESDISKSLQQSVSEHFRSARGDMSLTSLKKLTRREKKRFWKEVNSKKKMTTVGEFDLLFRLPPDVRSNSIVMRTQDGQNSKQSSESQREVTCSELSLSMNKPRVNEPLGPVHHWELTVKFLLYVGPWEVLGLPSPRASARKCGCLFHCSSQRSKDFGEDDRFAKMTRNEEERLSSSEVNSHNGTSNETSEEEIQLRQEGSIFRHSTHGWARDEVLGWYLGPHLGESLLDRKERLMRQLKLAETPLGSKHLKGLYPQLETECWKDIMVRDDSLKDAKIKECKSKVAPEIMQDLEMVDPYEERETLESSPVISVAPAAFLQGFLFYEYPLWVQLKGRGFGLEGQPLQDRYKEKNNLQSNYEKEEMGAELEEQHGISDASGMGTPYHEESRKLHRDSSGDKSVHVKVAGSSLQMKPLVNPNHWSGWWTCDLHRLVTLPEKRDRQWYIIPKLEWLSPVVLLGSDAEAFKKVLSAEQLLEVTSSVAAEARSFQTFRKQRFLLAELEWLETYSEVEGFLGSEKRQYALGDNEAEPHNSIHGGQRCESASLLAGAWVEVSRGFAVEATWPDSKDYRPHGFVPAWSPALRNLDRNG